RVLGSLGLKPALSPCVPPDVSSRLRARGGQGSKGEDATHERFKKKTEQVRILLDDLKKLSRFDNSTVPTLLRIQGIYDPYNNEEVFALARAFHEEGGAELYMKMLTSISPDASNIPDSLQRPMEWSVANVTNYVQMSSDLMTTFVDCGGLKFLLSLLKHHACQGLVLRFESKNTLRFAVSTLTNLSTEPELKSCFHQELAADVLACYLDVPDAPCKLSALYALARISTEQDLDIICNAQGAISLLTDMVNRPSYKDYTALENILYPATGLVQTLTMVSITAGIRRKTLQPGAELDEEVLQEILPELREKLKVETEKRDYTLEWGDIAVHPSRRSVQKWPKAGDGRIYVPYKVSVAFYDGDVKKIEEAALEFEKKTCVRFIPRSEEADYIYIHAREGNWSFLGRQGGDQAMSLEPGKVTKGVVLHELMHALGFHHEHCRSDRDDHVLVLSHNLRPEWVDDMRTTSNEHNLRTPYDYSSVTHYSMWASSEDHFSPTIIPIPNERTPIGQRGCLSPFDVLKIKRMYKSISEDTSAEGEQELEKAGVETKELISRITVDSSTEIAARLKEFQETLKEVCLQVHGYPGLASNVTQVANRFLQQVADDSDCGETLRKDIQMASNMLKIFENMPPEILASTISMASNLMRGQDAMVLEQLLNAPWELGWTTTESPSHLYNPRRLIMCLTVYLKKFVSFLQGNAQLNPPADPRPQNDDSIDLGPLPPGWEENVHTDGRTYFTNHDTQKTQWKDPRLQNCGATGPTSTNIFKTMENMPPEMLASLMNMGLKLMQTNPQLEAPVLLSSEKKVKPNDLGPLPPGWEESVRADGRSYFIDHNNKKTQWEDPRLQNLAAARPITEESEDQEKKTEESQTQEHDASGISDNPGEECKQQ
ncbi:unnamed protein product, partial [Lampetra fluviatilis]